MLGERHGALAASSSRLQQLLVARHLLQRAAQVRLTRGRRMLRQSAEACMVCVRSCAWQDSAGLKKALCRLCRLLLRFLTEPARKVQLSLCCMQPIDCECAFVKAGSGQEDKQSRHAQVRRLCQADQTACA